MRILVTGGAGYIGSHMCVELLGAGHDVVVYDNLSNSKQAVLARIARIAGRAPEFVEADVRDEAALQACFAAHRPEAVIHFAGLKAVGEGEREPLRYYENNVEGTLRLARVMEHHGVRTLVFSSSATVYGDPQTVPITESAPTAPASVYGRTKWLVEHLLRDVAAADPQWRIALLRYFNPVGAHPSGLIGEDPSGIPNNLMPFVCQTAVGLRPRLQVFGSDYPTVDGSGVRDYLHVMDLVRGHLCALRALTAPGVLTVNLGTGRGYSVLEVVRAFEAASGRPIPYEVVARRPGDIATCYADPTHAAEALGWRAEYDLDAMCRDAWHWQQSNPQGYPDAP